MVGRVLPAHPLVVHQLDLPRGLDQRFPEWSGGNDDDFANRDLLPPLLIAVALEGEEPEVRRRGFAADRVHLLRCMREVPPRPPLASARPSWRSPAASSRPT